jgi:tetratricopeptide (TPR) repeat protein
MKGEVAAELGVLRELVALADITRKRAHGKPDEGIGSGNNGLYDADEFPIDSDNARMIVVVRRRIGTCLVVLDRIAEGVDAFRASIACAREVLSETDHVEVQMAWIMLASCLHRMKRPKSALEILEGRLEALMERPEHKNSRLSRAAVLTRAECLMRTGKLEAAVAAFRKVAAMAKGQGLHEAHAKALQQAMRVQQAIVDRASDAVAHVAHAGSRSFGASHGAVGASWNSRKQPAASAPSSALRGPATVLAVEGELEGLDDDVLANDIALSGSPEGMDVPVGGRRGFQGLVLAGGHEGLGSGDLEEELHLGLDAASVGRSESSSWQL